MSNPYLLTEESYKRDLSQYETYCRDAATYISRSTGDPYEQCLAYVKRETGKGGKFQYTDPKVVYLIKESEGNRVQRETTLSGYFRMVQKNRLIMTPTLTAYTHPDDERSILAEYIQGELNNRSANKKQMLKYRDLGDKIMDSIYNNRQQRNKIKCNSLSGAHGTPSSVLFNQSAHSTLTSTCRSASSNTNANTERFLMGNRHYWSFEVAANNIVSIVNDLDIQKVQEAVNYYQLKIPTVEDVMWAINRCTDLYWRSPLKTSKLQRLVSGLSPYERCAYLYNGDMFNLARLNPELVTDLFDHLSTIPDEGIENAAEAIAALKGDDIALISLVCAPLLKFRKIFDPALKDDPDYGRIGAVAARIKQGIQKYGLLISALWVTPSIPASMASFPDSIRRAVVASDTDSSIFTAQYWTEWYVGKLDFSTQSIAAAAATTYLCSQLTVHVLATMSGNMGVAKEHLRTLEMKNEFAFTIFSLTTMAKHYFAIMMAQEGNVYKDPHWEIKGANMRNSKAPVKIMERAEDLVKEVVSKLMEGGQIELRPIVKEVAELEESILKALRAGDTGFYATGQIKLAEAYKQKDKSPMFQNYSLWNEVFGPKYGVVTAPPYNVIKINVEADSSAKMRQWLSEMQDTELAERFKVWLLKNGKDNVTTLWIPMAEVRARGVPEELLMRMDVKKMIISIMRTYYVILECLGYYTLTKRLTRMVSDDLFAEREHKRVA